ncbi:MAG: helix-turn-helix transcriptional regulator [Thermoplasmata archaeon]
MPAFHREGVGRPRKRYVLSPSGQELFPKKYGMILDTVVNELLDREGEGYVSEVFAKAGERMARAVAQELPRSSSMDERAHHLVLALNRIGFGCTSERTPNGRYRIVRTNCVFRQSALSHPFLLCEVFDKHLTEALLGEVGVDLEESIGRGGVRCTHLIPLQ